jgi:hypothetical protein
MTFPSPLAKSSWSNILLCQMSSKTKPKTLVFFSTHWTNGTCNLLDYYVNLDLNPPFYLWFDTKTIYLEIAP